jgi:2-polyprenyl-3-methyl-5-hydroxy-6-metoxy-1,4-benzoquinol methylase
MLQSQLSSEHQRIAEANRLFYRETAHSYVQTETCVTRQRYQESLGAILKTGVDLLDRPPGSIHALDACGGAGNAALKLQALGVGVTICDISLELLQMYRQQAHLVGYPVRAVCSEIGTFLSANPECFDLIVFSSALHHLADIDGILSLAVQALKPGGLLLTMFDPTLRSHRLTRAVLGFDYLIFKLWCHPGDVVSGIGRRLRRSFASRSTASGKQGLALGSDSLGVLAEYHVEQGIDDLALADRLRKVGIEVLHHQRSYDVRHSPLQYALKIFGTPTQFSLVVRRPLA